MQFRFLALNGDGEIVNGTLWARDEDAARGELLDKNFDVKLMQHVPPLSARRRGGTFSHLRSFFAKRRFSQDWKAQFFQQMHALLNAGITIEQAVSIIADGCEKTSAEYAIFNGLLSKICTGRSLSDAMSAFKDKFSYAEINIIRAAEHVGQPQRAIGHLCEFSKTLSSVRRKIVSAMVYPCIVLIAALCVLSILSVVIVPQFQAMFFTQMHRELPLLTRGVVSTCTFFREHILLFLVLLPTAIYFLKFLPKSWKDRFHLRRIPIVFSLVREYNMYLFTSALSMLLTCKVQLQEGLDIAKNVVFDENLLHNLNHRIERIKHGELISDALGGVLSKFAAGLVLAGEHIGSLDASLAEISESYKNSLLARLALITTTIEPALIVTLAIIVGIVIIAIFLPMIDMMEGIGVY
ncbi:MAG: type II secretion system F family protein [Puniceicoccales bacterium]|jgi:type IV pilus assembly protein PilC|nr:type II secretion system F family protein [Puniceicoccales bacterium]